MNRLAVALMPLGLCACGIQDRAELRWIGQITATANPARCPSSRAILILRAQTFTFAPDQGTWLLTGGATATAMAATRSRPASDHKTYETTFHAQWTQSSVHGTYVTPLCAYKVDLDRI